MPTKFAIPLVALFPRTPDRPPQSEAITIVSAASAPTASLLTKWLESMPAVATALLGFFIVHKLTQAREREKSVFELYRTTSDQIIAASKAAASAWAAKKGTARRRAVAETYWRVQQVGATAARLRTLSVRYRWRKVWGVVYWWRRCAIDTNEDQIAFRQRLTGDELFNDPHRDANNVRAEELEAATGDYQAALDQQLYRWL